MNKFFTFLLLLLAISQPIHANFEHVKEGQRLIRDQCLFFYEEMNFNIFGSGGSFVDQINKLEITLETCLKSDLDESRILFLICLLEWMNNVNADEKAIPFLKNYPLEIDNLNLRIIFGDYESTSSKINPKISFAFNNGKQIVYCYRDEETKLLKPFHRECFYDSLKFLDRERARRAEASQNDM